MILGFIGIGKIATSVITGISRSEIRYKKEAERLYEVLNKRLEQKKYLAGDEYTIADIATWPWIARFEWHQINIKNYKYVSNWYTEICKRDAVQKGYDVPSVGAEIPSI